jgi:hypothetical protein
MFPAAAQLFLCRGREIVCFSGATRFCIFFILCFPFQLFFKLCFILNSNNFLYTYSTLLRAYTYWYIYNIRLLWPYIHIQFQQVSIQLFNYMKITKLYIKFHVLLIVFSSWIARKRWSGRSFSCMFIIFKKEINMDIYKLNETQHTQLMVIK